MSEHKGIIHQIIGPVIDVKFSPDEMPELQSAIEVEFEGRRIVSEVAQHIGDDVVRCVAAGRVREAYELLLNEDYPGWLHCVRLGATTIWERWNSLDEMGHITGIDMNSLNHYAYGAIVEWLFAYAAGLRFCVHEVLPASM